ncbi:manganese efflux pump MntP [Thermoactinomyces mirandus]|uniref:Putative manganese efflux pump MntP n=1 Tax=Thermoactinomyces mirandus TaxID=2756294 RepID=A0A7W2ART7_9BACL|nr:manganese efflux pump MntP family protein [Thermoactinomyces mirandus]MBA4602948.1 manganese efflux pump [Thermoactinomyces mirandus]
MELTLAQWGQVLTLSMIAVALGMDAFSLGIGLGMRRLSVRQMAWLSLSVGIFHILMPLVGMGLGRLLGSVIKEIAVTFGGGMLCFQGLNMLYQVLRGDKAEKIEIQSVTETLLLSLSVSMDSLSAGLSLGLFDTDVILTILLFGIAGLMMAGTGLLLGRFVGGWIGRYGEILGGFILLFLGGKFLF